MAKSWKAACPSNIALIKYMGKKDVEKNIPANPSISWTLDYLQSTVILKESQGAQDIWSPMASDFPFEMSETGQKKYLSHLRRMKEAFGISQSFEVCSANNFPADCGIASSASSFAALTEVSAQAFSELTGKKLSLSEKAMLSAQGSGSSCRSFQSGLVLWKEEGVSGVETELKNLSHMVVLIGQGAKKVSSSEAHRRVSSSLLYETRVRRSEARLNELMAQINPVDWSALYRITWAEFWDMHALFETSDPAFGYFLPGTIDLLNTLRDHWEVKGDGPLVTMDAGPNIHLLWRDNQKDQALDFYQSHITEKWTCLSDIKEIGFAQV